MESEVKKGGLPAQCRGMWESTGLPWKPAGVNGALQLQERIYSARAIQITNLQVKWHIAFHLVSLHCQVRKEGYVGGENYSTE